MELRPYQDDVVTAFGHEVAKGRRRVILVAPTGAGKTVIAAEVILAEVALGRRVVVLSHRREIITQTCRKLHAHGIPHGIIQAGFRTRPLESVQSRACRRYGTGQSAPTRWNCRLPICL
jgi:DNA repair protein RadD